MSSEIFLIFPRKMPKNGPKMAKNGKKWHFVQKVPNLDDFWKVALDILPETRAEKYIY